MTKIYKNKEEQLAAAFKKFLTNPKLDKHKNYDFTESEYTGSNKPLTFKCSIHNKVFTVYRASLIYSTDNNKCLDCAEYFREFVSTERFIKKANERYNGLYDYSKVEDYHYRKEVTIICPIHGEFKQRPDNHLKSNTGCTECGINYAASLGGYTKESYIERCKADKALVYVIKIIGNGETFYKIGITSRTTDKRFIDSPLPDEYSYEIIKEFTDLTTGEAFDLESKLHELNKENVYRPLLKFAGYRECFTSVQAT